MTTTIPSPGSNNLWNQANPDSTQSSDQINNQQMQTDYDQWYSDELTEQNDETALATAIANLVNVSKEGNYNATFEAMMMFFTQVFPDVLNIQQDNLNTLSDTQNMSSDLRSFVTSIENDSNQLSNLQLYGTNTIAGSYPSATWSDADGGDLATDFYGNTCDLYAWAHFLGSSASVSGLTGNNFPSSALSSSTAVDIEGVSVQIADTILNPWGSTTNIPTVSSNGSNILQDSNNTNWLDENATPPTAPPTASESNFFPTPLTNTPAFNIAYVCWLSTQSINYVTLPPSSSSANGANQVWTDNTPLKTIQQQLQTGNSNTSSMATTTQTTEQFYTNQYNQLTGIDNSMQQSYVSEISSIIQNETPN